MVNYIHATIKEIEDGSWLERSVREWGKGNVAVTTIEPEPSNDPQLREAIDTMLDSTGAYSDGDIAVIHTRHSALDMAGETALALQDRGVKSAIVLGMMSLDAELMRMMKAVYGDIDFSKADTERINGLRDGYQALLAPMEENGNGHWIVTVGTPPISKKENIPVVGIYSDFVNDSVAMIGDLRNSGHIKSHDIWLSPTELDVERLNQGLHPDDHWNIWEWRELIFKAMAISAEELKRRAMDIEGVRLTIEASLNGGKLRYWREDGTDFTYSVKGRPVILGSGKAGNNSLGGTTPYRSPITNQPGTEVYVSPIEDSMDGVGVYTVSQRTNHGIIGAPYRIWTKEGEVIDAKGPDDESTRILRHYTGLEPYDGKEIEGDKAAAFRLRRRIAEVAIAGFNPVTEPDIRSGRLRPVTGLVLTDEKQGDHNAYGNNDHFGGETPSTYKGEHYVEHTDFVGSTDRNMELLR